MPASALPERVYGLTVVDGHRSVRPGDEIRLWFRARCMRAVAPAVRACFAIPASWTALDPLEGELQPCGDGEQGIALRARAETADEVGHDGAFQVLLQLPEGALGSNVVRVAVRGRPRFAAPRSAVRLAPGEDAGAIRALVTLENEGDAVARGVRIVLPPPPGFVAAEAPDEPCADIAPGATLARSLTFRAGAPSADTVVVDGARIRFAGGEVALGPSAPLALAAHLLPPDVDVVRRATRLDVGVRIVNTGTLAARDVALHIAFPSGWRASAGATTVDAAPAAGAAVRAGELALRLPFVPAGGAVIVRSLALARRPRAEDRVSVRCAEAEVCAAASRPVRRSLQLDARAASALVAPAETVAVNAVVWNDGESDESVTLHAGDHVVGRVTLRAGCSTALAFALPAPAGEADTTVPIRALAADGETLASGGLALRRAAAVADIPAEPPVPELPPPVVRAVWEAPERGEPGAPVEVRLRCRVAARAALVSIRPHLGAARYVAGSTRINGHAVVDDGDEPPLLRPSGLRCYDVADGAEIDVSWKFVPDGSADVVLAATIGADGTDVRAPGPCIGVFAPPPFAARPDGLPFHVDAAVVAPAEPPPPLPAPAEASPLVFGLQLDAPRRAGLARMLQAMRGNGIAAHLPLVAALFPESVGADDALLADAVALAGENVRATYERIFVKLRIPGYDVGPYDLEDAPLRGALLAVFDAAAATRPAALAPETDLHVALDRAALREARERLARAPLGGIDAVGAIVRLLPRAGAGPAGSALAAYASLLADELEAARALEHDAFAAYLALHVNAALDRARAAAIAALTPVDAPAGA